MRERKMVEACGTFWRKEKLLKDFTG